MQITKPQYSNTRLANASNLYFHLFLFPTHSYYFFFLSLLVFYSFSSFGGDRFRPFEPYPRIFLQFCLAFPLFQPLHHISNLIIIFHHKLIHWNEHEATKKRKHINDISFSDFFLYFNIICSFHETVQFKERRKKNIFFVVAQWKLFLECHSDFPLSFNNFAFCVVIWMGISAFWIKKGFIFINVCWNWLSILIYREKKQTENCIKMIGNVQKEKAHGKGSRNLSDFTRFPTKISSWYYFTHFSRSESLNLYLRIILILRETQIPMVERAIRLKCNWIVRKKEISPLFFALHHKKKK